jgi:hypothetical protein
MNKAIKGMFLLVSLAIVNNVFAMQGLAQATVRVAKTAGEKVSKLDWLKTQANSAASYIASNATYLAKASWDKLPESAKTQINSAFNAVFHTKAGRVTSVALATLAVTTMIYKMGQASVRRK